MSASGTVVLFFQEQVFQDLASPKVTTYPGFQQVYALVWLHSHFHRQRNSLAWLKAKVGLFPLSALAATVSAEEPRSGGQTLVCVPQVKESFLLMMKYLDCLETTLFWTLSAMSFITFALSACQEETHLE